MQNFKHHDKRIEFFVHHGEVIGTSKRSETHVFGGGGGGYIGPNGGHVSGVDVSSYATTEHEIWIRKEDGKEHPFQISNRDIPLREGHKITMICARDSGSGKSYMTTLVNHTIGRHWPICNAETLSNYFNIVERPPKQALGRTIIFGLPTALLLAFVPGISVVGALLLGLIGWGVFFANDDTKCKHLVSSTHKRLEKHIEHLTQNEYRRVAGAPLEPDIEEEKPQTNTFHWAWGLIILGALAAAYAVNVGLKKNEGKPQISSPDTSNEKKQNLKIVKKNGVQTTPK